MSKINNNHKAPKNHRQKAEQLNINNFSVQQLYQKSINLYQENNNSNEDRWNKMLAQSGTKKDKISAAGALILENPLSSLKYFDLFIKWCFDKNPNFAITSCQAVANIYTQHLFTNRQGLKDFTDSIQTFIKQHKKKPQISHSALVAFYIQSQLKQYYSQFIKAIQILLNSDLSHIKKASIKILGSLARHIQLRRTILALIVNKLGDTDMDIVNQVSKCLKDQFYQDILASQTLIQQTQRFLFRANLPYKAQFFVINFLNNINLKFLNEKTLKKLFQIFYHFFTKCVSSQQNSDQLASRLFLNSIKGLNKVFAFMKGGPKQTKKVIEQKLQDVYKIVHTTPNIKAKIQLLLFLFQSHVHLNGNISSNSRFYRVLYDFIGKNQIIHCSLLEMFFDLLLVCMKEDQNLNRILAMSKRMLHLCFSANSAFVVTTLLMLDKVIQSNEGFRIFLQKNQNVMNDNEGQNNEYYDNQKRDPLFAGAQKTCLWELKALSSHFHPTVRKFANAIIQGQAIQYQGNNPILQFNLTSFIQKISLKKQKKSQAWKIKVKRNMPKIRSSKYESLLNKQLSDFKQDEDFIKKYLQKRSQIHTNRKKIQTKDIQQYADQVIEQEMDRLNPKQMDEQLSITPIQDDQQDIGEWEQQELDQENQLQNDLEDQQAGLEEEDELAQDLDSDQIDGQLQSNQLGDQEQDQEALQQKEFEDVFDEIRQQDSYQTKKKNKNKRLGFNKNSKRPEKKQRKFNKNIKKQKFNNKSKPKGKKGRNW